MDRRFSLRSLFIATTFVALFFAVRRFYVYSGLQLGDAIFRASQLPLLFAALAVVVQSFYWHEIRLWRSIIIGTVVSALVAATLTIEIAEYLRRSYEYWNWSADFFLFVQIVAGFGFAGSVIGALLVGFDQCVKWIAGRFNPVG